jgi:SAM-dependent methyltransferase
MAHGEDAVPAPTDVKQRVDTELHRWSRIYAGDEYYYGEEAGPVARRAVRYHRPYLARGGTALDAGCGEGQDLAFLAERGYDATGIEFTQDGAVKSKRLLEQRGLRGEVLHQDLRELDRSRRFNLVLAVNSVQFMGQDALPCLEVLQEVTAPGGVMGLSLFGCEGKARISGTILFISLEALLDRFQGWQPLEAAKLWQWNVSTNEPQPFVTLIARKAPPAYARISVDAGSGS